MKNQAILTLSIKNSEIFRVALDKLSPRGCEFICGGDQIQLFRDQSDNLARYKNFQIRLGLFPHSGPCPQYLTANGQVSSLRRSAQDRFRIHLTFDSVSQDGYRLIAEHLSDSVITPIKSVKAQSA
jgi:hypothetical protein